MSTHINDGGPAFPRVESTDYLTNSCARIVTIGGMSLRDYFAAQAINSLIIAEMEGANNGVPVSHPNVIGDMAYRIADGLLAARAKQEVKQ